MDTVVIENGVSDTFTPAEAKALIAADVIYRCPECGPDVAHISPDRTWEDVDNALVEAGFPGGTPPSQLST